MAETQARTQTRQTAASELWRHSSSYLTGRVAGVALSFISFPVLTRVLSVAEYGMLNLVLTVLAVATIFSKMGLQNSVTRFYEERSQTPDSARQFYSTLLLGAGAIAVAITLVFAVALPLIPERLASQTLKRLLLLGSGLVFVRGMQSILLNFMRAEGKANRYNVVTVLTNAATLLLVCLALFTWRRSIEAVLYATIAMEAAGVAAMALLLIRRHVIDVRAMDWRLLQASLMFGAPLVGYELVYIILDSGDRLLVQQFLGYQALGYYSAAYNMAAAVADSLRLPVNLAILPIYMKLWGASGFGETQRFLSAALDNYILTSVGVLAAVVVTARDVVVLLGSAKLMQAYPLVPALVAGLMLYSLNIFVNAGLIVHKKTLGMVKLISVAAVVNIALNVALLPRIGLQGAALATFLSYGVFIVLMGRASFAVLPLRFNVAGLFRYLLAAGAAVLLASRVEFAWGLPSAVARGVLSLTVYTGTLWVIDSRFRTLATEGYRWMVRRFGDREPGRTGARTKTNAAMLLALVAAPGMIQAAEPVIFYSDLESGPNSGGENNGGAYVTIWGRHFGDQRGSASVTIGGGPALAYPVWSDNRITVQLGPRAKTGDILVSAPGGTSNGLPFTVRGGRILFVSGTGKDGNSGEFASPWATLAKARNASRPGDIIYAVGDYRAARDDGEGWNSAFTLRAAWCSPGIPRALVAYPGSEVTIGDPAGVAGIRSTDPSGAPCGGNWVFSQLRLRGAVAALVLAGPSSDWRVVGNDISCPNGDGASGCAVTLMASRIKFLGNHVHDAGKAGPPTASALYHGVYFSTDAHDIEVGWNRIANIRGCRGLQFHSSVYSGGVGGFNQYGLDIHDNLIHDTQCDGIVLYTVDPSKGRVAVYNNIIYNAGQGPNNPERTGNWSCVYVAGATNAGEAGGGNVEVYNNTFHNCGGFANPPYGDSNAAIKNGGHNRNLKILARNNIVYQVNPRAAYVVNQSPAPDGVAGSHNLFYGIGPLPANPAFADSVQRDPLFVDPARGDFHLKAGSPARSGALKILPARDYEGAQRCRNSGCAFGALDGNPPAAGASTPAPTKPAR